MTEKRKRRKRSGVPFVRTCGFLEGLRDYFALPLNRRVNRRRPFLAGGFSRRNSDTAPRMNVFMTAYPRCREPKGKCFQGEAVVMAEGISRLTGKPSSNHWHKTGQVGGFSDIRWLRLHQGTGRMHAVGLRRAAEKFEGERRRSQGGSPVIAGDARGFSEAVAGFCWSEVGKMRLRLSVVSQAVFNAWLGG